MANGKDERHNSNRKVSKDQFGNKDQFDDDDSSEWYKPSDHDKEQEWYKEGYTHPTSWFKKGYATETTFEL